MVVVICEEERCPVDVAPRRELMGEGGGVAMLTSKLKGNKARPREGSVPASENCTQYLKLARCI